MLFDKERMAVQAGKPVEFLFENTDIMPHNFVIVKPGNLEEIGEAAEAFATQAGAAARQYVPPMPRRRCAAFEPTAPDPRQRAVEVHGPEGTGYLPLRLHVPGPLAAHARRALCRADLDAYLENPEAYLAKNPLPVKDELLKYNRPRTEWKLEELADAIKEMEVNGGRNFANGRQMFTVATCVACHKFAGQGNDFGPDLTQLDPKVFKSPFDVTDHILDPAKRIEDKYAMYRIVLDTEKVITAMIVEEKDGVVKVIENPLASAKPLELKATAIVERKKLTTSIMPKGLLDKLTREEVLDLLAYVWAAATRRASSSATPITTSMAGNELSC
jgi:putative heme-binding domain-containing protein